MSRISSRARAIAPSATLAIAERVAELRARGVTVHDLGLGEADWPASAVASERLARIARTGRSRYTAVQGVLDLRRAAARWFNRSFFRQTRGAGYVPVATPDEVVVGTGSKYLLYAAVMALCEPGDEVVLLAPYWTSYPDVVRLAGAVPVVVPTDADEGWVPPVERIADAMTPRTRLVLFNSPSNPTGRVWPVDRVMALCEAILERDDVYLLADEIYGELVYGAARHVSPVTHSPRMHRRTIVSTGLSKAWSMGGWRVGVALVADPELRRAIVRINGATISCAPSAIQDAAAVAFDDDAHVAALRADFAGRAAIAARRLAAMGLRAYPPEGAFYAFADVTPLLGAVVDGRTLRTPSDVAMALLEDAHVACVGGEAFGDGRHVRLSFVLQPDALEAAFDALEAFVLRHRVLPAGHRAPIMVP